MPIGWLPSNGDGTFIRAYLETTFFVDRNDQSISTLFLQIYDGTGKEVGTPLELTSSTLGGDTGDMLDDVFIEAIGHGQYAVSWDEKFELPFDGGRERHTRVQIIDSSGSAVGDLLVDKNWDESGDSHLNSDLDRSPSVARLPNGELLVWSFDEGIWSKDENGEFVSKGDPLALSQEGGNSSLTTDSGALLMTHAVGFYGRYGEFDTSLSAALVDLNGNIVASFGGFSLNLSLGDDTRPYDAIAAMADAEDFAYVGNQQLLITPSNDEVVLQTLQYTLTFTGTDGADVLTGMDGGDVLNGLAGNDRLLAGDGDDTLFGGNGADTLNGGDGDDLIFGGGGLLDLRDVIYAGAGDDTIDAGYGNDLVNGMEGDDQIAGGFGADELRGNSGNDTINGGALSDLVFGGDGDDFINGGFGFDRVNGGAGADKFYHEGIAGHGSDWIQDFSAADGDVLLFGNADATVEQFIIRTGHTEAPNGERSGDNAVEEAFIVYQPTGQIIWALVDGAGQDALGIQFAGASDTFDLLG